MFTIMIDYTLQDLKRQAEKQKKSERSRFKTRYDLARSLGFSGAESRILMSRSEEVIRRLAKEKNRENGQA